MIEVEELDGGFRVVDAAKNEVTIEIDDWEPGGEELEIGYDVTETLTGRGTEIRLPNAGVLLESPELENPVILNMNKRMHHDAGELLCRLAAAITVFVRISVPEAIRVENSPSGIHLTVSQPANFTIGFKDFDNFPGETLRIPPTIEGAAEALNVYSSMHETETPDRAYPSERPELPNIELSDEVATTEYDENDHVSPIRIRIPRSLDFLFPIAPLAFYLGAGVIIERRGGLVLNLGSEEYEFSSDSKFPDEVASLLRRIFYLDCLVREVGPRRLGIKEFELLDVVSLDPAEMYRSSMLERLEAYLRVPFETIDSDLPDWPLLTYVNPTTDNLSAIPFLLDKLSMVFPPKSSPIDRRTWVKRSLGDFYRSTSSETVPDHPIEVVTPEAHRTCVQGWIAPGNPVDAFKGLPEAFENQSDYLVSSSEPILIKVVLNDDSMDVEHSRVLRVYRDRAEELSLKLEVLQEVTSEELASVFESPCDFLHYIGHCDPSGLRCVDGNLSAEELSRSKARTFFLNACGSFTEGLELIRKGSVAGAVTFGDVINAQAAKVGVDFARLYMYGYTIDRALFHARGQAIMNRHYAIVGDGTHILTQGDSVQPAVAQVTTRKDGLYSVRLEAAPVNLNGAVLLSYIDSKPNLVGNHETSVIDEAELEEIIPSLNDPIIYDNKFYWPEELLDELF